MLIIFAVQPRNDLFTNVAPFKGENRFSKDIRLIDKKNCYITDIIYQMFFCF